MNYASFTSSAAPPRRRRHEIEQVCGGLLRMEIDLPHGKQPYFNVQAATLPGLALAFFNGSRSRMVRTAAQAKACPDDVILCVAEHANVRIRNDRGREVVFAPGNAHVWTADRGITCEVDGAYSALMLGIPRTVIDDARIDLFAPFRHGLSRGRPELNLLVSYATLVARELDRMSPLTMQRTVAHLHELAVLAFKPSQDERRDVIASGVRAVRLKSIEADILKNLLRPELTAEWMAARHRISGRYLRSLFAGVATSFTDFVVNQRLLHARRLLTDVRNNGRSISELAYESGFGDLSYFNRRFRRRFGVTPTELRMGWRD